ncbi:hypothetical protein GOEFS_055_00310 [Gordonia effusa NBRC 100432]|uniref:Integral membrane protein n=1 Tax=Gordonia effusa NBRC 100432 TaxID=1077974 RepID=H0R0B7_9ACTN|nr:hypothetical protein [Gordonia effusa]GAB18518.1 hypothetical protein GOEFS_055_00310 [Gordonia effusa NBRC 100432]
MSTTISATPDDVATSSTYSLRNLYYARFVFAIVWAGLLVATASTLSSVSIALLVIYPLFDVGAAVFDLRSSREARATWPLYVNMGLSLLTAVGLVVAVSIDIPAVLRVWGAWAITAGIVQVVVAVLRRRLGGQWAMILSGAISVLAGGSFIAQAGGTEPSLAILAGYATLGGIFFLVSAINLHRRVARR